MIRDKEVVFLFKNCEPGEWFVAIFETEFVAKRKILIFLSTILVNVDICLVFIDAKIDQRHTDNAYIAESSRRA